MQIYDILPSQEKSEAIRISLKTYRIHRNPFLLHFKYL